MPNIRMPNVRMPKVIMSNIRMSSVRMPNVICNVKIKFEGIKMRKCSPFLT
jgi:hypothetical protein